MSKTFFELSNEIYVKQQKVSELKRTLDHLPGSEFMESAIHQYNPCALFGPTQAQCLVEELTQSDYPITRSEMIDIFEAFGADYTDEDIDASNPSSDERTAEFRVEWDDTHNL